MKRHICRVFRFSTFFGTSNVITSSNVEGVDAYWAGHVQT